MRTSILYSLPVVCTIFFCVSARADTVYVNTSSPCTMDCGGSWGNAYSDLQDGIDAAFSSGGGEVWVAQGDYEGTISLRNGVKVYGGFDGTETRASDSDPIEHVTTIRGNPTTRAVESLGNDRSAVLRGFNIVDGGTAEWEPGAGVYIRESSPMIVACTFRDNKTSYMGGGVAIAKGGSPLFVNCTFHDNEAELAGGAVWNWEGSPTFHNCLFYNNSGGDGGAVASKDGTPTLVNCTIVGNTAKIGNGGALYDYHGTAVIHNSILWHNVCAKYTSHEVFNRFEATMVTHSDVAGGWPGEGNIDVAPLFVDPSTGDYRIQSVSPCRDAGSTSDIPANEADLNWDGNTIQPLPHDLNGMHRINESAVDMGAYEHQSSTE